MLRVLRGRRRRACGVACRVPPAHKTRTCLVEQGVVREGRRALPRACLLAVVRKVLCAEGGPPPVGPQPGHARREGACGAGGRTGGVVHWCRTELPYSDAV